jgi:hypothetical protein
MWILLFTVLAYDSKTTHMTTNLGEYSSEIRCNTAASKHADKIKYVEYTSQRERPIVWTCDPK